MADEFYRRLACVDCGVGFLHPFQTGRPPKTCLGCRPAKKVAVPRGDVACAHCKSVFYAWRAGKIYCGVKCAQAAQWVKKAKCPKPKSILTALRGPIRVKLKAPRQTTKSCVQCGVTFEPADMKRKLCSDECRRKRNRLNQRPAIKANRARRRGAVVEVFRDIEVLERDNWTCQICGVATPKTLRGTYKPNAPEVDHIIAIANGGAHARWNCQCACRQCNGKKGAGPARGQLSLMMAEEFIMAGVKGRSGGKRPGAGRPRGSGKKGVTAAAPAATQNSVPGTAEPVAQAPTDPMATAAQGQGTQPGTWYDNPLDFLIVAMNNPALEMPLRVRAALSAAQYKNTKPGDGGKKEQQAAAAKTAAQKFRPSAPPPLRVVGR